MVAIRQASLQDIGHIQKIEREYYDGFSCPEETLSGWMAGLPENFLVAETGGRVVGFLFFEYLDEVRALPFVHPLESKPNGAYCYVSEIGVLDEFQDSDVLQRLFDKMAEKSGFHHCKAIIWLTGEKGKHDRIEKLLLIRNGFRKKENVKRWEAFPGFFVDDHWLWSKEL